MSERRPSFQFYPGDWLRDSVAGCSLAAQGLWLRLMMIMHDSTPYGMLATTVNGTLNPTDKATLIRRVGASSAEEYDRLLAELVSAGVPAIDDRGVMHSRRMVRDERKRLAAIESGKRGGNPQLRTKQGRKALMGGVNRKVNPPLKSEEEDKRGAGGDVFVPPTPQEVEEFAKTEKGVSVSGEHFCDSYAKKGWMVGKVKMKDWRAAVRGAIRDGWILTENLGRNGSNRQPGLAIGQVHHEDTPLIIEEGKL